MRNIFATMLLAVLWADGAAAAEPPRHEAEAHADALTPALSLSPGLRAALVAEMNALKQGIGEIAAQLATGEWTRLAANARQVRDSYIMNQQLTDAQREELARVLPPDFVALDTRFHRHAESLAHAALARDADLTLFYYGKLLEGCQLCHSRYATHSLEGFRQEAPAAHQH